MKKINLIFIYFFISVLTSVSLFSIYAIDYGIFYSTAQHLSDTKKLYTDLFVHKGPLYFIFVKIVGSIFGWGEYKIVLPYFFSILFFLLSNLFLLHSLKIKKNYVFIFSILFLGALSFQNSNASLIYIQFSFLNLSLGLLSHYYKKGDTLILIFSIISILLSSLVRIDSIAILFVIFFSIIIKEGFKIKNLLIIILVPILTFFLFSNLYSFSFKDFIFHNLIFNKLYLDDYNFLSMLHRPNHLKIISSSGILFLFLLCFVTFSKDNFKKIFKLDYLIKIFKKNKNNIYLPLFLSATTLLSVWLYSKLEVEHHVLTLFLSLYFYCLIYCSNSIKRNLSFFLPSILLVIMSYISSYSHQIVQFIMHPSCLKEFKCNNLKDLANTIIDLKNHQGDVIILDPKGYEIIFSKKNSKYSINNWPIINNYDLSFFKALNKNKEHLLNSKTLTFWSRASTVYKIKKFLIENNFEIKEIENQGYYYKYRVRKKI
jgi:hypothetical protein